MVAIRKSTVIGAPVEEVWRLLRDFNGHASWHPAVAASVIEDGRDADEIACVRDFRLADGAALREQLLSLSDRDRSFSYCILDAPIPLVGYVATVRLKPVTDGRRTFWEWNSVFAAPAERTDELARLVGEDIYEAGFNAVKRHFGQGVGRRASAARPSATAAVPLGRAAPEVRPPATAPGDAVECQAIVIRRYGGPTSPRC